MSDKIAVMHEGKILQYDTPEMIYKYPSDPYVGNFIGHSNWITDTTMFRPEETSLTLKNQVPARTLSQVTLTRTVGTISKLGLRMA